ncbi:MAG: hypothetical protein NVS4B7_16050 [Ktedonobacteraceae bacterium]
MSDSTNSIPLKNNVSVSNQPQQPLQTNGPYTGKFPEGKTYAFVVVGFFVCENLTNIWLPALGLRTLAHQYENIADFIAPYLLLPICLFLVLSLFKRSLIAGCIAIVGSLMLDWFFFIRYDQLLSRLSLVVYGIAVLLSYIAYRSRRKSEAPQATPAREHIGRWQKRAVYTSIYIVSFLVAVYTTPLLRQLTGQYGRDVSFATSALPTLVVLVVYLLFPLLARPRLLTEQK